MEYALAVCQHQSHFKLAELLVKHGIFLISHIYIYSIYTDNNNNDKKKHKYY